MIAYTRPCALIVLALVTTGKASGGDDAFALELVESRKIWDRGAHNAFTDLTRFEGAFFCVLREGSGHVSQDGKIRVLRSVDGGEWSSVGLLELGSPGEGSRTLDLRDPKICVTPDARLMVLGGAARREGRQSATWHRSFVTFSDDGRAWEPIRLVAEENQWLWRVTWHEGKAYGVSYDTGPPATGEYGTTLQVSEDGIRYRALVPRLRTGSRPTEATLRFGDGGTCYCLLRRDGRPGNTALLGVSEKPYTRWRWSDLGVYYGGPDLIRLAGGVWIGGGRLIEGGARTVLTRLDTEKGELTPLLTLPSGGDTSYPGLLWHEDELWVSYYSSHEGKTSIYVARVRRR